MFVSSKQCAKTSLLNTLHTSLNQVFFLQVLVLISSHSLLQSCFYLISVSLSLYIRDKYTHCCLCWGPTATGEMKRTPLLSVQRRQNKSSLGFQRAHILHLSLSIAQTLNKSFPTEIAALSHIYDISIIRYFVTRFLIFVTNQYGLESCRLGAT